jgi:hypothetical protein
LLLTLRQLVSIDRELTGLNKNKTRTIRKRLAALVLGAAALGTVWAGQAGGNVAVQADPNWGVVSASDTSGETPDGGTVAALMDPTWG